MEIRFYQLLRSDLESALAQLLERTLAKGWRAVVYTASAERAEALSRFLWTYAQEAFLPHGTAADGGAPDQPIWLTDQAQNPNGAHVCFAVDGVVPKMGDFSLICDVFDGRDPVALADARQRWQAARAQAGVHLSYWQQTAEGWEKKAA